MANQLYYSDGTQWLLVDDGGTGGGGAGGSLIVQDENGNIAASVTQIDFQGGGVAAATAGTGEVVVTIPLQIIRLAAGAPVPAGTPVGTFITRG